MQSCQSWRWSSSRGGRREDCHENLGEVRDFMFKEVSDNRLYLKKWLYTFEHDKIEPLEFSEHCVIGKATRLKFSTSVHSSGGALGYVHSNLWGHQGLNLMVEQGIIYP